MRLDGRMERPKDLGYYPWMALGAVVIGLLAVIAGAKAGLALIALGLMWAGVAAWRAIRIHRWVQSR